MDDLDILFSRIEQLELAPGTREAHLTRITQATGREACATRAADPIVELPVRRRHTAAAVLTGAAVVAIVTGAWILFAPHQSPATTPMTQPASSPSTPTTIEGKTPATTPDGPNLLTAETSATELAEILHISPAAAHAGLIRLAALVDPAGGLDPTSDGFHAVAADLGTTAAALEQALIRIKADANPLGTGSVIKPAGGSKTDGSSSAGPNLLTAPNSVAELAGVLHIPTAAARTGLTRLAALADRGGHLDGTDPQFRAIAADLGTTPTALNAALAHVKASAAGTPAADTAKSGSPSVGATKGPLGQADLLTAPGTAAGLAKLLHISPAAATAGLARLAALANQENGLNPTSHQFTDIAADMGTTATALKAALGHLKAGG
jgi:hypothetical protein